MKRKAMLGLALVLVGALILVACGGGATPTEKAAPTEGAASVEEEPTVEKAVEELEEKTPIKIGLHAPLTGPVAFLGLGFDMGIQLAIEDLGGEIEGHPIEYVTADNKCNPTDAVNAVSKLIDVDEVHAIIGGGCSSATVGALPIIAEGETPSVSATSTNPGIYNSIGVGGNIWAFRINPDDLIMALGFGEYIHEQGATSVSLVAENTDFGRGAISAYKPIFESIGVENPTEDYFDLGTADFRPALTRMKGAGSDAVLIVMTENDCANFLRQYREVGVEADVYSRGSCTSPLANEMTADDPSILEGVVEFSFFFSIQDPELAERFEARWETPLTPHRMGGYYAMYYALRPAITQLIQEGKEVTRENVRAALEKLLVETPAGPIEFDDHHQAYPNGVLVINRDGEAVRLDTVKLGPVDHSSVK